MLYFIYYWGNANQIHNEILSHICKNSCIQGLKKISMWLEKKSPSCPSVGFVNLCSRYKNTNKCLVNQTYNPALALDIYSNNMEKLIQKDLYTLCAS